MSAYLRKLITGVTVVFALALAGPALAQADATISVTTTLDGNWSGASSCTSQAQSPAAGACSLRAAVEYANSLNGSGAGNITIEVPAGDYKFSVANTQSDPTYSLDVSYSTDSGNVDIVGAGASTTIVDAEFLDQVFSIGSSSTVTISGLTMQDGRPGQLSGSSGTTCPTNQPDVDAPGGGIIDGGVLTLTNDVVTANMAAGNGGGIEDSGNGTLTVTGSEIEDNVACATSTGSAVGSGYGGGIDVEGSTATVGTSTISGNQSAGDGGGISVFPISGAATLTASDSAISGNSAGSSGGGIAGEFTEGPQATINLARDLISANTASTAGGILAMALGSAVNTTIAGNTATGQEGGGGIVNTCGDCGSMSFSFSTIVGNQAPNGDGGNIFTGGSGGYGDVQLDDSIVANGSPDDCSPPNPGTGGVFSAGYNLLDSVSDPSNYCGAMTSPSGTDLITSNPKLGSLADNGGPTETVALLVGSPALDAAEPVASCQTATQNSSNVAVDQRGGPVTRPQGPGCDIGAFEATPDDDLSAAVATNPITVGQQDTVTDTITNNGPEPAPNSTFTDPTAGFTIDSATPSQGTCSHTTSTVTCNLGTLAPGQKVTVTLIVTGTSPGVFTLNGAVAQGAFDPTAANNTASVTITVIAPATPGKPSADLAVAVKPSKSTVTSGDEVTFTLTASNLGPDTGTGVEVVNQLPAGFSFRSSHGSTGTCSGTQTVTCKLGSLAVGAHDTITIAASSSGAGKHIDDASITGTLGDPNLKNNVASATVTTVSPSKPGVSVKGVRLAACTSEHSTIRLTITAHGAAGVRMIEVTVGGRRVTSYHVSGKGPSHKTIHVAVKGSTLLAGRRYSVHATVTDALKRSAHGTVSFAICMPAKSRGFTG